METVQNLVISLKQGELSRRGFVQKASALGITGAAASMLATNALAQDATPETDPLASPVGTGEVITSMTRAEYYEQLKSHYQLEEATTLGGDVVHTYTTDISTLNTILSSDIYSSLLIGLMYEGLVGTSPIDGTMVPSGFADYWEIAEDGVTYTFHLNPNATWHDGEPVTADDVVFTIDLVMAEGSPSVRTSTVTDFLASWEKVDDHTVQLVALNQSAVFLENTVGLFNTLPQHIWQDVPLEEIASDPGSTGQDPTRVVGSGPFRFVEWTLGSQVILERNEEYWDQENVPYIDRYIFNVVAEASTQIASLQTGETDFTGIASSQIDDVKASNPEIQITEVDSGSFTYYMVNQDESSSDMFVDVETRQALHYALDRNTFADTVMFGYAIRADGTQPVLSPAYAPDQVNTIYDYNPEQAVSLLEQAGWIEGADGVRERDGVRLSFECLYSEGSALYETAIPFMQQYWREVGIEMIPAAIPFPTLLDRIDSGQFEMSVLGFSWGFDGLQGDMFRCNAVPPNGFNNMSYCNEEYDALDRAAQAELDDDRRRDLLIDASNIVNDEMAIGVIVFAKSLYGASPRLNNFHPEGYSGYWWIQWAWMEPEA